MYFNDFEEIKCLLLLLLLLLVVVVAEVVVVVDEIDNFNEYSAFHLDFPKFRENIHIKFISILFGFNLLYSFWTRKCRIKISQPMNEGLDGV